MKHDDLVKIAHVCHDANRAYCLTIGDKSQVPWGEAEKWQQDSSIAGVKHALANPGATPEQMHRMWMEHKLRDGWKFGKVKDSVKKEHPCLVPHDQLPDEQQKKDRLFLAIVRALS